MLTHVSIMFEDNSFTRTLLFCATFLRKIIKIKISDQLLYFVVLRITFQICVNHIAHKQTFNNVHICDNNI
jgi:hypothetical protein